MFYNKFTSGIFMTMVLLASLVAAGNASAKTNEQVLLRSLDGSVEIVGELIAIEKGKYQVVSSLGSFWVSSNNYNCYGEGCPVIPLVNLRNNFNSAFQTQYSYISFKLETYFSGMKTETQANQPFRIVSN